MLFEVLRQHGKPILYDEVKTTMLLETALRKLAANLSLSWFDYSLIHYDISQKCEKYWC